MVAGEIGKQSTVSLEAENLSSDQQRPSPSSPLSAIIA